MARAILAYEQRLRVQSRRKESSVTLRVLAWSTSVMVSLVRVLITQLHKMKWTDLVSLLVLIRFAGPRIDPFVRAQVYRVLSAFVKHVKHHVKIKWVQGTATATTALASYAVESYPVSSCVAPVVLQI